MIPKKIPIIPTIPTITIIGGGCSGTLLAIQLLRLSRTPIHIQMVERKIEQFGLGLAYSTSHLSHLLNVAAVNMGAFPEDVADFSKWIQATKPSEAQQVFQPRKYYGEYLRDLLRKSIESASPDVTFESIEDDAAALEVNPESQGVRCKSGRFLPSDQIILALGNFPPANPTLNKDLVQGKPLFYDSPRYFRNPWVKMQEVLSIPPQDPVLLIGSGLTMVDVVLSLRSAGHRAKIHILSRHGLMPAAHPVAYEDEKPYPAFLNSDQIRNQLSVLQLYQMIRKEVRLASGKGYGWRSVIDSLRPFTQEIWKSWPQKERARFVRHLRSYWEVHRHRIPPQSSQAISALLKGEDLVIHSGRLQAFDEDPNGILVRYRRRGSPLELTHKFCVSYVLNCTGPETQFKHSEDPLIKQMIQSGIVRSDVQEFGLDTSPEGAVLDRFGQPSNCLWTLGPPRKGLLWETTAVPEIRVQARDLAQSLLAKLEVSKSTASKK